MPVFLDVWNGLARLCPPLVPEFAAHCDWQVSGNPYRQSASGSLTCIKLRKQVPETVTPGMKSGLSGTAGGFRRVARFPEMSAIRSSRALLAVP